MVPLANSSEESLVTTSLHSNLNHTLVTNPYMQSTICPCVWFQMPMLILHISSTVVKLTYIPSCANVTWYFVSMVNKMVNIILMHQLFNVLFCEQPLVISPIHIALFLNLSGTAHTQRLSNSVGPAPQNYFKSQINGQEILPYRIQIG